MRDHVEERKRAGGRPGLGREAAAVRQCLAGVDGTSLQNILMRMPDKVCAVGLALLPEEERGPAYALMAPVKSSRVRAEIRLEERRRTTPLVRGRIVRAFLSYFGKAKNPGGPIWIRPRKRA
jgi:hypothetical protein